MSYQQLTEGKRYQISLLISQERTQAGIARQLKVNRSTIGREVLRNSHESALPGSPETLTSTDKFR